MKYTKTALVLLTIFFTLFFVTAKAQINKGRYSLGGSISYNNGKGYPYLTPRYESLDMYIQLGKVVKENAVEGLIFSYNHFDNPNSPRNDRFSGGIFYRKYKSLAKNFYFFGEGDALYSHARSTLGQFMIGYQGSKQISNGASLLFVPGISYSVSKRMQMELLIPNIISLSYTHVKTQNTSAGTTSISTENGNSFSADVNLNSNLLSNVGIGFKFFLGK